MENINYNAEIEYEYCNLEDLNFVRLKYNEILNFLENRIIKKEKTFCVTVNLDILRLAFKHPEYYQILKKSDFLIADGMPIVWLSKLIKQPIPERSAGSDIVYDFCKLSNEKQYKIFMLGAGINVANIAKEKLKQSMPNIQIVGVYSPTQEEIMDDDANRKIVEEINNSKADILFVALGAPKQETWVSKHYNLLSPYVIIPCGGSIDFLAGTQKKAGKIWGQLGLEWVYRFINNPKKFFKRYFLQDMPFLFGLILRIKFNAKK